jgi:NaMN:DMB phosphoribosyltransferase
MKFSEALALVHEFMRAFNSRALSSEDGVPDELWRRFVTACGDVEMYRENGEQSPLSVMRKFEGDPLMQQTMLLRNFTGYIDKE